VDSIFSLRQKRDHLIRRLTDHMDFLIGSVSTKSLRTPAFNLTTKVEGVTKSLYIPRDLVPLVRRMTARHKTFKTLIKQLHKVNWQLVRRGARF